jgi:hypothetical protein
MKIDVLLLPHDKLQARDIESSLKERLVQTAFCDELQQNVVEAPIQSKSKLKNLSRKLVECVYTSNSLNQLRISLEVSKINVLVRIEFAEPDAVDACRNLDLKHSFPASGPR